MAHARGAPGHCITNFPSVEAADVVYTTAGNSNLLIIIQTNSLEVYLNALQLIAMSPQGANGGGGGMFSTVIMFGLIIVIFYFMILRPQQKKQKERTQLLESIQKGDKVVTIGGLHGTVLGLEEKTVLVQVADNVKLKFEKSAISSITRPGSETEVGKTS